MSQWDFISVGITEMKLENKILWGGFFSEFTILALKMGIFCVINNGDHI